MAGVVRAVRQSLRSLARSPGFTIPALLILTIGVTAATAIFTVVDAVVFRPLDYPDAGRLVVLCEESHQIPPGICVASPTNVRDIDHLTHAFTALGFARGDPYSLSDARGTEGVYAGLASAGFFRALGVRPALGRLFTKDEIGPEHRVVMLSHRFWVGRYGADPGVLGRTVRLDGKPFEIVGVLPKGFAAPFDLKECPLWRPPDFHLDDPGIRGWRGFRAIGRLAPGVTLAAAASEVRAAYAGLATEHKEIGTEWTIRTRGLQDTVVGTAKPIMLAFLAAAALLLLVVCANVANLLLTRGLGRRRELAVRAALGAGRRRLVLGIFGESLILTVLATMMSLLLAGAATHLLLVFAPPGIPRLGEVTMNGRVFAFAALTAVLATAVFGVLPAARATDWNLAGTLRGGGGPAASSSRLRDGLVAGELAVSTVLLVGATLLTRSFVDYVRWKPGFSPEHVLTVSAYLSTGKYHGPKDLVPFYRRAHAALAAIPGVVSASSASAGPLFGGGDGATPVATADWDGVSPLPTASWFDVGPGYFSTLGVALLRGREFTSGDGLASTPVAVVNASLARLLWPGENPVGRTIRLPDRQGAPGRSLSVVGVVANVPPLTPGEPTPPQLYWPNRQAPRWGTYFVVRTAGDPRMVAGAVTGALRALDPDLSVGTPRTLTSQERKLLVLPRFEALILLVFALAALALSAVGVYAVVSYSVASRVRELGIRRALGAASDEVVRLVVRRGMVVAFLGVAGGLGGAYFTVGLLRGLVHGVSARDPWSFAAAAGLLFACALVASCVPARRAGRVDPLEAIRAE